MLHGLNAVYIESLHRWVRLDARGNKPGVDARFSLEEEKLAFLIRAEKAEEDIPIIFSAPDENVLRALKENKSIETLWVNLPTDIGAREER